MIKKYFNQLLGAGSARKLVEIPNNYPTLSEIQKAMTSFKREIEMLTKSCSVQTLQSGSTNLSLVYIQQCIEKTNDRNIT